MSQEYTHGQVIARAVNGLIALNDSPTEWKAQVSAVERLGTLLDDALAPPRAAGDHDDAKLATDEYARQILAAAKADDGHELYLVAELLREYGAKAYRQGREHFAADVQRLVHS